MQPILLDSSIYVAALSLLEKIQTIRLVGCLARSAAGADSGSDEIGGPINSVTNFSTRSSSDCTSFKTGRGKSRRPGAIALSVCNLARKIGNNEVSNAGSGVAIPTPLNRVENQRGASALG
jgi:hypothetical protein